MSKFQECPTCAAKPGSPTLCNACLHNRTLIEELNKLKKPPLGIPPKRIILERRAWEIHRAMGRYIERHKKIPIDWTAELHDILKELSS